MGKQKQIKITINEEYLDLMKRPTKDEYRALHESILLKGQRVPIIINESGVVLDGHTRFEILENLGIFPKYVIEKFESNNDEMEFIIEANVMRRHYQNKFQYIQACYPLYQLLKARQIIGGDRKKVIKVGTSTAIIGRKIGCNRDLVEKGIWLIENADKKTIKKLESGFLKINKIYFELKSINFIEHKKNKNIITKIRKHYDRKYPFNHKSKQKTIITALTQYEYILKEELMNIIDITNDKTLGSHLTNLRNKGYTIKSVTCYKISNTNGLCHKCFSSNVPIHTGTSTKKPICETCFKSENKS